MIATSVRGEDALNFVQTLLLKLRRELVGPLVVLFQALLDGLAGHVLGECLQVLVTFRTIKWLIGRSFELFLPDLVDQLLAVLNGVHATGNVKVIAAFLVSSSFQFLLK